MEIIRKDEKSGIAVVQVDKLFYVVRHRAHNGQVESVLYSDMGRDGTWVARATDTGVKYVASGRSRAAAMAAYRREMKEIH